MELVPLGSPKMLFSLVCSCVADSGCELTCFAFLWMDCVVEEGGLDENPAVCYYNNACRAGILLPVKSVLKKKCNV